MTEHDGTNVNIKMHNTTVQEANYRDTVINGILITSIIAGSLKVCSLLKEGGRHSNVIHNTIK